MLPAPEEPVQEAPSGTPSGASPYLFGAILAVNVAALGYLTWELRNYIEAKNSATVALSLKADHDRAIEMLSAEEAKLRLKVEDLSASSSKMSSEKERIERELTPKKRELEDAKAELDSAKKQLAQLKQERSKMEAEFAAVRAESDNLAVGNKAMNAEKQKLTAELETLRKDQPTLAAADAAEGREGPSADLTAEPKAYHCRNQCTDPAIGQADPWAESEDRRGDQDKLRHPQKGHQGKDRDSDRQGKGAMGRNI